ncbi:SMC-Scp complex subunit ScpB [Mycoplasma iguanae]|uniref:SMC-Scp complex subunit ScpB n=1 Tax=Mycoplasma iguanae TaxID=292461 RepID=A0ABY5R7V5_9MOLU|nr:SMC-Scp complex subunit ScpB [Mycoplasma iguanae]UVD81523.1 SMC-Scp complex subunit ScpB [Mycoplasma iguanae]
MDYKILEALLYFQGEEGLSLWDVKALFEIASIAETRIALKTFQKEFNEQQRGIFIVEFDEVFKLATIEAANKKISQLVNTIKKQRLSNASIETIGIIAYKQPITRSMVSEIRGINSDHIFTSLLAKGMIEEVGIAQSPGNPILYGVTNKFFDYFRIKSLKELPKLMEFDKLSEFDLNSENDNFDLFASQREIEN